MIGKKKTAIKIDKYKKKRSNKEYIGILTCSTLFHKNEDIVLGRHIALGILSIKIIISPSSNLLDAISGTPTYKYWGIIQFF